MSKSGVIVAYKSSTGRINPIHVDKVVWENGHFVAKATFELLPNERVTHTGIEYFGRWFWTPLAGAYEAPGVVRKKDGTVDEEKLPKLEVTLTWNGPGYDSEPRSTAYKAPHGPNELCTCKGCWACDGFEMGCTCDIDWEAMREASEMAWLESQS